MKLKLTKPKNSIYQLFFGLVLIASFIAINIPDSQVYAAISFNQLKEKINSPMRNYCAPVKGDNYTKCTGHYTAGAAAVYNASSEKEVNNQLRTICTPPIQNWVLNGSASDCGAFAEGVTTSQGILGKSYYNGGGSQGGGGSQTGGGSQQNNPPPITECNKINNTEKRKECKQKYQACNPPPESRSRVPECKREVINQYVNNGGEAGLGCQTEAGSSQCRPTGGRGGGGAEEENPYGGKYLCGNIRTENNGTEGPLSDDNYYTKFNFGCVGEKGPSGLNPIEDLAFAILRFLSVGVGIAVVLAIVGSGIQYTMSEGNAEVTGKAKKRIRSAVIGLVVYIFAFSLFQYLVPGGIFWPGNWIDIELAIRLLW